MKKLHTHYQSIKKQFEEIFGEKHHLICEGKNCECRKQLFSFFQFALVSQLEEVEKMLTEIVELYSKAGFGLNEEIRNHLLLTLRREGKLISEEK